MLSRLLIAPVLGASLAAILVLGARSAEAIPGTQRGLPLAIQPLVANAMTLSARPVVTGDEVVTVIAITGLRSATVGNFGQEPNAHANGRLFIDTTDAGAILGTPDQQRVKLTVQVTPANLDPTLFDIRWEVRDPDDPADDAELDASPQGGDDTGTPHEFASHWFLQADHAISNQIDRPAVDETTVIGEARTAITNGLGGPRSTVYFRYGDDGGDNYQIRVVLRQKTPGVDLDTDESGVLTVWRKRLVGVYAMTKPNDDVQTHAVGSNPGPFAICITAGANGQSDTMILGGDDQRRGERVQTGPNGIVETTANSGGNSFDPEATVALFRSTYATAGANGLSYIDWDVTNEQFDGPYEADMTREDVRDYMHDETDFVHGVALMSLLGVNAIGTIAGNASYPPHCGVAVGTLKKLAPVQLPKTDIHEIGHLLIGAFETVNDFHNTHSVSQLCGYRQGLQDPQICSRHANLLRDRVGRTFGNNHSYFETNHDSVETR